MPTFAEGGYPNFTAASWVGFFAPAKTAPDIVAKLNAAIDAIVKEPETQARLAALGFDPIAGSQLQAETYFKTGIEKWGRMITTLGISVN